MTDDREYRPLIELAAHRDELVDDLVADLDVNGRIRDTASELDNELAEHNHAAVVQGVDWVVSLLQQIDEEDVRELAQLAAVSIPGHDRPHEPYSWNRTVPAPPTPKDPASITRRDPDEDEDEDEWDVEREFEDDLTAALQAAVDDWAFHLRDLLDFAADLAHAVPDHAQGGDVDTSVELLPQRDAVVLALQVAVKRWELALAADMDRPGGPPWQIAAFEQWLATATAKDT